MILKQSGGGNANREPVKAGMHVGRCYLMVDLGTHIGSERYGFKKERKIQLAWEIPSQRVEFEVDGEKINKPAAVYKKFTASLHEKSTLRAILKSWRGRDFTPEELSGFDMKNTIGAPCLINITHTPKDDGSGGVWENVSSVTPLMEGQEAPPQENESIYYSMDSMGWNVPDSVYPWLVDKIKESVEFQEAQSAPQEQHQVTQEEIKDCPF